MTNYYKPKLYYMRVNEKEYNPHFPNFANQKNMDHRQLNNHYCPHCAHPQPVGMPEIQWDIENSQSKDNVILPREDVWGEEMNGLMEQDGDRNQGEVNIWHGYGRKGNPWI